MKCPYDNSVVQDWFTKEKDHILWLKGGDIVMAGLFIPYRYAEKYVWMEKGTDKFVKHDEITHYMVIPY
jgi:hypothetical protein